MLAGVLSGVIVTSICCVIACLLEDKLLPKSGSFIGYGFSWFWVALFTAFYAVPFGIVTGILLTTANVIWRLNFLQSVGLVTGFGLIICLLCLLISEILKEGVFFTVGAIIITTIINSAAISAINGWLQQPLK